LTVPPGWQGTWPTGSEIVVLGSEEAQAYIFILVDEMDEEDIEEFLTRDLPLENGLTLHPEQSMKKQKSWYRREYTVRGSSKPLVGHVTVRQGPHEIGVALMAVSAPETSKSVEQVVDDVARGMEFQPPAPQASPQNANTEPPIDWQEYLKGRHLIRLYTGSGYSEEEHVWLCSNGSFFRSASSGGFGGGASGAFGSQGQGSWRATGQTSGPGTLILTYGPGAATENSTSFGEWKEYSEGGEEVTFNVVLQQKGLYLNETRWFRQDNQRCQ
jgi:hypothetical protein